MRQMPSPHQPVWLLNTVLLCPGHALDQQPVHLYINAHGRVQVQPASEKPGDGEQLDFTGSFVCLGFVDLFCTIPCPGAEYRDTFASAAAAAQAGGFTHVVVHSDVGGGTNQLSAAHTVAQASTSAVQFLPTGNVTQGQKGESIAELYDLANAGVVAYTDGRNSVQSLALLLKALQYSVPTGKPILQLPVHGSLGRNGLMNEGVASTRLGMPGSPAMAEWVKLQAELELLRYAGGHLHYTGVSTAKSLQLLQAAQAEGLAVSFSVSPMHLSYCDEDLAGYDANYKIFPCLRTVEDREVLRSATVSGQAIAVASHHLPQNNDAKDCEFEYAQPGVTGLQTAFHQTLMVLPTLSAQRIAQLFSYGPRQLLSLPTQVDAQSSFTIFSMSGETPFAQHKSRSHNHPLFGQALPGRILATIHSGQLHLNT